MLLANSYEILKGIFLDNMEIRRDMKVLDIGCGWRGNFCNIDPGSYYGTDRDSKVIEPLITSNTGYFSAMDVKELKFDSEYFDYAISVSLLHHLSADELKDVVAEVKRVLKKGGKIIFADGVYPESKFNLAGWLIRFFDRGRYVRGRDSLRKLLSGYFFIEKEYYFTDKIFAYSLFVMSIKK